MPKLRNVNPLGDVYFPLLGRDLAAGEEFEVDDATAAELLKQVGNFEPAGDIDYGTLTVADLEQIAAQRGIDLTGLTKKADIVAAIKKG